ncbi:Anti-sigma factor NepR domain-containing protein [Methylorubrum populi]
MQSSESEEAMADPSADPDRTDRKQAVSRDEGLSVGRVTKGVAFALGKRLSVEKDAALPDRLASLVDRLQAGPLGRTSLKHRRVA